MSDRKAGYSPLNSEKNRDVTNDVIVAYVHEKININILLSVLSIFCLSFYDFNQYTKGFVSLEFVKYQLGRHRNIQVFAK